MCYHLAQKKMCFMITCISMILLSIVSHLNTSAWVKGKTWKRGPAWAEEISGQHCHYSHASLKTSEVFGA